MSGDKTEAKCHAIVRPFTRTNYVEPKIIAVRNSSGINLSVVSLREVRKPGGESVRMGSISPVQTGVTPVFNRPSSPPPLPKQIVIS